MKKLFASFREWLKADKSLHIILSTALVVLVFGLVKDILVATIVAFLAGLLKELVWDKWMKRGVYNMEDVLANLIGIVIGICYCVYFVLMMC